MTEQLILNAPNKIQKKIDSIMKKMKFSDESLFLKYCIANTYKPYASAKERIAITKELKLILKHEAEQRKK